MTHELKVNMNEYLPLRDVVFNTLRQAILKGELEPGERLMEIQLADRLGVSRTPIREALIRLAQDRFVELIPNKGAIVPYVTINDIVEVYQLRMVNDGLAAALVAGTCTDALLQKLEASVLREEALLEAGEEPLSISKEDFVFHDLILYNCGNRRLVEILELINNQMHRFARAASDTHALEHLARSVDYHRRVLEAIRARDADAARASLSEHWQVMLNGYISRSLTGTLPT